MFLKNFLCFVNHFVNFTLTFRMDNYFSLKHYFTLTLNSPRNDFENILFAVFIEMQWLNQILFSKIIKNTKFRNIS